MEWLPWFTLAIGGVVTLIAWMVFKTITRRPPWM